MITLIAAIGLNNEIGFEDNLPWRIPEDMAHFKNYTMCKVVIMGRKTYTSIKNPLPGRKCVVVTTSNLNGAVITTDSISEALSIDYCYPELVIIGGESIYKETINFADKLVITHIDAEFKADKFFPDIDLNIWKINSSREKSDTTSQYNYRFVEYVRNESHGIFN